MRKLFNNKKSRLRVRIFKWRRLSNQRRKRKLIYKMLMYRRRHKFLNQRLRLNRLIRIYLKSKNRIKIVRKILITIKILLYRRKPNQL